MGLRRSLELRRKYTLIPLSATGMTANPAGFFDAFSFALGGAFWAYMGWYATTFLAGEVKEANKKLPKVLLVAGLVIMAVYLTASSISAASVMNVAVTQSGGHTWSLFQAYGWLSYGGVDKATIAAAHTQLPNSVEHRYCLNNLARHGPRLAFNNNRHRRCVLGCKRHSTVPARCFENVLRHVL